MDDKLQDKGHKEKDIEHMEIDHILTVLYLDDVFSSFSSSSYLLWFLFCHLPSFHYHHPHRRHNNLDHNHSRSRVQDKVDNLPNDSDDTYFLYYCFELVC